MKREDFIDVDFVPEEDVLPIEKRRATGDKIELVKFDGTAITTNGNIVKHNWFKGLELNQARYADILLTAEEAMSIHAAKTQMKIGAASATPLTCYGAELCPLAATCPFIALQREIDVRGESRFVVPIGRKCHPPGTMVMTTRGPVPIERLDPTSHKVWGWYQKQELTRSQRGVSFRLVSRQYDGIMHRVEAGGNSHDVTSDHLCVARFNSNAVGKYCIYLMRSGDHWRIGQTTIMKEYNMPKGRVKSLFGPGMRAAREEADALWILDICDSLASAHLMEEYYSIEFGVSKAGFVDSMHKMNSKYDGFSKWVTAEELRAHHDKLKKPICHYAKLLEDRGLSIEHPIWRKEGLFETGSRQVFSLNFSMHINACNLISGLMDVPVLVTDQTGKSRGGFNSHTGWATATVSKMPYSGVVYSLDVDTYHAYIANQIVTHNCPIEQDLLYEWVGRYAEEFGVTDAPGNYTDQRLILELAECEVLENRMNTILATKNQDLTEDKIVAVVMDKHGEREQHVKEEADALKIKERLMARKERIRKSLVATRFDQYKREAALQETSKNDTSNIHAALAAKLKKIENMVKGD